MHAARCRLLALLLALIAAPASAHLLNMTRVQVDVAADGAVEVTVALDLSREIGSGADYYRLSQTAAPLAEPQLAALFARLAGALNLLLDGRRIELQPVAATMPQADEAEFLNPMAWPMTQLRLQGHLPTGVSSGFLQAHFDPSFRFEEPIALTLQHLPDQRGITRWLVAAQLSPRFPLQAPPPGAAPATAATQAREAGWATALRYLRFGFLHILPQGLDHVLFVLGLYLGSRSLRALLLLVTTFTLAHSVTLILSSIGAVRLSPALVEPAIALSIAWIGVENLLLSRVHAWRTVVVFLFGLLHGLGFAAALAELGLPQRGFIGALLSFNVGVEFGQLAVIALALLLTGWLRPRPWYRKMIVIPGSMVIALLGMVWMVQRLHG